MCETSHTLSHETRSMNVTKKKTSYGNYEVTRDGTLAAIISKTVDSSDPRWELMAMDGTDLTFNGKRMADFCTLAEAFKFYTYCRKHNHA